MFTLILLFFVYIFIIGFLTILERKILGLMQNRLSVFKNSFLSLYHFYLDFFKVFFKGNFGKEFKKFSNYLFLLVLIFLFNLFEFYFLIFGFKFDKFFFNILIIYLLIEGLIMILKILILNTIKSTYISITIFRIKWLYILLEGFFSYIIFFNLIILNYIKYYKLNLQLILLLIFIFYIIILLKIFRNPFDFFEVESELTGGIVLEFKGISFLLWSLFEYSSIFNSHLFLIYILSLYMKSNIINYIFIFIFLLTLTFIIRGVFIRFKYYSTICLICFLYYLINLIFLFIWFF
uniref:NADH dehydrogenase subunit 1 n=1 Tax=Myxobolus shantungensis TaxID=904554 RepID=UPI003001192C